MAVEMIWTPTDGAGPAGQFHATEAVNMLRASNGAGVLGRTFSVTVATMTITFPAFKALVPNSTGHLVPVTHAGGTVVVAASDATNPRTSIIQVNSAGTLSEKAGTATAETGDVVEAPMAAIDADAIALLKVRVAAAATTLTDSVMKGRAIDVSARPGGIRDFITTAASTTSTSEVSLMTFTTNIPVTQGFRITFSVRKQALAAQTVGFGLMLNATSVVPVTAIVTTNVQQAEDGQFEIRVPPRVSANYLTGLHISGETRVTATGAQATGVAEGSAAPALAAALPNAAYTSVILRGINNTASNVAEIGAAYLWND